MDHCCENKAHELAELRTRQAGVLKTVMAINLAMFFVEFGAGLLAGSSALLADSLDMLGDAIVYAFSLYVLHKSVKWRAGAALLKGIIIVAFGVGVLLEMLSKLSSGAVPVHQTMGWIGALALVANATCLALLSRHRDDDLNMKSTWICSRNDIISNAGVLIAAGLVHLTGSSWPDIVAGAIIAAVFLRSAVPILLESIQLLRRKAETESPRPAS